MSKADRSFDEIREHLHRQMLSAVSHDLKTPLATMIGSLEIHERMYERLTEDKRKSLVSSALTEAYRLDSFISNILDMAKLESGVVKAKAASFNLYRLIQDEIVKIGPKKNKGRFHICEETFLIDNDSALLGRILGILIDNALRHSGEAPEIWIDYMRQNAGIIIRVRDNGPGIEKGDEEKIFDKYMRLGRSDQQNAGTGLGLSIARAIAEILGGTLIANNGAGGGAVFTLSLPEYEKAA